MRPARPPLGSDWRFWCVVAWFAFTLSLAAWQAIFSHRTLMTLSSLAPEQAEIIGRHLRMVRAESVTMLCLLLVGGVALGFLLLRERRATEGLREFLATFTHELRTSLSSLRLQAEMLEGGARPARLLADLERLDLQLENSLGLARGTQDRLLKERVGLKEAIGSLQHSFSIPVHLQAGCDLLVDRRAFESILKNLVQNATLHGQAQNLYVDVQPGPLTGLVQVIVEDDGRGADADPRALGALFHRPGPTSRTGIGLYLVARLARAMGGEATFQPRGRRGFVVRLLLPGSMAQSCEGARAAGPGPA